MPFTIRQQDALNAVICELHPHKALLNDIKPRFYVIRHGWGTMKRILKSQEVMSCMSL